MKLLLLTFLCISVFAQSARVIFVKGKVTALLPGDKEARQVKKGDIFPKDTSILTKDKSIVRLKFDDKSIVNLGPKSKVVVEPSPKAVANVVNILTGAIKAEVQKQNKINKKTKLKIETHSAVMGVRGTKFQTSYNPKTNKTALVTVEGEVEIASKENLSESVPVKPGKASVVTDKIQKPTVPVNIAPKQFDLLAKSMDSDTRAVDVMNNEEDDKDPNRKVDLGKDLIKYKAGGYIDFATGEYIEPSSSDLDEGTNTYLDDGLVSMNKEGDVSKIEKRKGMPSWLKKILPQKYILGIHHGHFFEENHSRETWGGEKHKRYYSLDLAQQSFLHFEFEWSDKWSTILNFGGGKQRVEKRTYPVSNHGDGADYFNLEVLYKLQDKLDLTFGFFDNSYITPHTVTHMGGPSDKEVFGESQVLNGTKIGVRKRWSFLQKRQARSHFNVRVHDRVKTYLGNGQEEGLKGFSLYSDFELSYKLFNYLYVNPSIWAELSRLEADSYRLNKSRLGFKLFLNTRF